MTLLSYIPFLHPMNWLHDWWYLLVIPLSFGISVIYRAIRSPTLERFWRTVWLSTAQIVLAMIALAIVLIVLVQVVVPRLPV